MKLKELIRELWEKLWIKSCPLPQAIKQLAINFSLSKEEKNKISKYIEYEKYIEWYREYNSEVIKNEIWKVPSIYETSSEEIEKEIRHILINKIDDYGKINNIDQKIIDRIKWGFGTSIEFILYIYYVIKTLESKNKTTLNNYYDSCKKILSEFASSNLFQIDIILYTLIKSKRIEKLDTKDLNSTKWFFDYNNFEIIGDRIEITEEAKILLDQNLSKMQWLDKITLWCPALYAKSANKWSGAVLMDLARIIWEYFDSQNKQQNISKIHKYKKAS